MQFAFRPIRGRTHAERLESFYGYQASRYDDYRERFLIGRREMVERLPLAAGSRWLDAGCGTGYLLDCAGGRARECERIYLVDLAPSLLDVARQRVDLGKWTNVEIIETDITSLTLDAPVDVATFSYSLTMIPDWFAAIDQAEHLLTPNGAIGVADFFVSRRHSPDSVRHSWLTRNFWRAWFDSDHVSPSQDHLAYLTHKFEEVWLRQARTRVVGLPFLRPPCYQFVGRKR
jgi:S-adenosylmethionine-diacylgycerolhomoserine-N-methlytransferase